MKLSKKIGKIEESGIRKVFEQAQRLGSDSINLSIGQSHFPVPDYLKQEIKNVIDQDHNSYVSSQGYLALREKIATKLQTKNNIKADSSQILVTSGVSGAIHLALSSIIDEGDEVVLMDPYFVLYKELLSFLGAKILYHDTYPDFKIKAEKLEKLLSKKTKLIILNSPNNPSGAVYTKEELSSVADIAKKHDITIISDEIYEDFDFENKFFSIASIYKNTITLNGFSKNLSVGGWRLAYAHGPEAIINAMTKLQMYTYVCAPSVAQVSVANVFEKIDSSFDYKSNRDMLLSDLDKKYKARQVDGAFYAFLEIPREIDNFFEKLEENSLLVVPGAVFSQKNTHFRLSFASNPKTLTKGIKILNSLV